MPTTQKPICCPKPNKRKPTRQEPRKNLAALAKALAHPARVQILEILKAKKTCVCGEIVDELPLAQATVSQHLKVLKEAGFIRGEISGPKTCYCLDPNVLQDFKSLVARFLA